MQNVTLSAAERHFLEIAESAKKLSGDPKTKVGAAIVTRCGHVLTGYNGFPPNIRETPERWLAENKSLYVVPAIINAMAKHPGADLRGATAYLSYCGVCTQCARQLIVAGVSRVVFKKDGTASQETLNEIAIGHALLQEAGVELVLVEPE